jgi:hypothetical protein
MPDARFEAVLERKGSGTFVVVPVDVPAVFGRVRAPVRVTINGHPWRSTVMRYDERYLLGVSREHRTAAGIAPGDTVAVALASDDAPRVVAGAGGPRRGARRGSGRAGGLRRGVVHAPAGVGRVGGGGEARGDAGAAGARGGGAGPGALRASPVFAAGVRADVRRFIAVPSKAARGCA